MADYPLRRGQLVAPFGVGSIITSVDGVSAVVGGLDHWIDSTDENFQPNEFIISDEWRLSQELGVEHFVLPPDFRMPYGYKSSPNSYLSLPAVRFPLMNFCPSCHAMKEVSASERGLWSCENCQRKDPQKEKWRIPKVIQMQFLAMCQKGHIEDFPYSPWVHRQINPTCNGQMTVSFSGVTLASQRIFCSCGQSRSFAGIFGMNSSTMGKTNLSSKLSSAEDYLCNGRRPWLNDFAGEGCGSQLMAGLRGAINNYYPNVRSAIYLPKDIGGFPEELMQVLQGNDFQKFLEPTEGMPGANVLKLVERTSQGLHTLLRPFLSDVDVAKAIDLVRNAEISSESVSELDFGDRLKAAEYSAFSTGEIIASNDLKLKASSASSYSEPRIKRVVTKMVLIDRLRETRAFVGFSRVKPEFNTSLGDMRKMLRLKEEPADRWLPAYTVYGEGIYLEFDSEKLDTWARRSEVQTRVQRLKLSDTFTSIYPNVTDETFLPRLITLHTLSHLLINEMIFESGYSAAALRERIYCSTNSENGFSANGLLIYTASGDSEGSMGGLVRLGQPGRFELIVESALDKAIFCSSDPVCMEMGEQGQGPDSLNLAACHSCALLPETSCEMFNTFLDRALIIGSFDEQTLGLLPSD